MYGEFQSIACSASISKRNEHFFRSSNIAAIRTSYGLIPELEKEFFDSINAIYKEKKFHLTPSPPQKLTRENE
uniref:Uncharacterized protein n=1 Tax=Onchocerca volvulus TaxID=6282 RepID=A0A8R1TNE9_ONCVO